MIVFFQLSKSCGDFLLIRFKSKAMEKHSRPLRLRRGVVIGIGLFLSLVEFAGTSQASAPSAEQLYRRLTGLKPLPSDPKLAEMKKLLADGAPLEAAHVASGLEPFYSSQVKSFAAAMATKGELPSTPLNDFIATLIGATRDDLDARTLLTGDFAYVPASVAAKQSLPESNLPYATFESEGRSYLSELVKIAPQRKLSAIPPAGLLTTRGWGQAHLEAGTNRRGVVYAMREFLCAPIESWRDVSLPDLRVRRDVPRNPGGDPATFQAECRGCHAPMDALGGAYARYDFVGGNLSYAGPSKVVRKMNNAPTTYPMGYQTVDDSWINLLAYDGSGALGWNGPSSGYGLGSFAKLLSDSKAFGACMASRAFARICRRDPVSPEDSAAVEGIEQDFINNGYRLRYLFERTALDEAC